MSDCLLAWSRAGPCYPQMKRRLGVWNQEKNWRLRTVLLFFFLTHSVNTVGEGKDVRMLSGEKPGVWRKDF